MLFRVSIVGRERMREPEMMRLEGWRLSLFGGDGCEMGLSVTLRETLEGCA